jgi:hypothetical protein
MRPAAVLSLLALAVAGCGAAPRDSAQDFKGDERAVAAVVERLESAARDDDPAVVCTRLLSTTLLAALRRQGTNCRTGVKEGFRDADSVDLTVADVQIRGTRATAKVDYRSRSSDKSATLQLDREGNAWRISSLGAPS